MKNKQVHIIAVRAYGDFTILLHAVLHAQLPDKFIIYASVHVRPLFNALSQVIDISSINIQFQNFHINKSLLGFFTNRYFFRWHTIKEIKTVRNFISQLNTEEVYVEQLNRVWGLSLFMNKRITSIAKGKNVYNEFATFFEAANASILQPQVIKNVLILPTARVSFKTLPEVLITKIRNDFSSSSSIAIAEFKPANSKGLSNNVRYASFSELIQLILDNDLIFCPDSLAAHLCQLLGKPHIILYPNNHTQAFLTPYVLETGNHYTFETYSEMNKHNYGL